MTRFLASIKNIEEAKRISFSNIDINDTDQLSTITKSLKIMYEDYWKNFNQINTSIKLPSIRFSILNLF